MIHPNTGAWRVRIRDLTGAVQGSGVLVTPRSVVTCAHVVANALATDPQGKTAPLAQVTLDFPLAPQLGTCHARVATDSWIPLGADGRGDLAILHLPFAVSRPWPARLESHDEGRPVRLCGHPHGNDEGVWTSARISGGGGPGNERIRLETLGAAGTHPDGGFSGAGVLDPATATVVGIVVAEDPAGDPTEDLRPTAKAVWMLPTAAMARYLRALRVPAARLGPEQNAHLEIFALVDRLLAVPVVGEQAGRNRIVEAMRTEIAVSIPRHPQPHADVFSIVRTCLKYPGGLRDLMDVVRTFDPGSPQAGLLFGSFDRVAGWLDPTGPGSAHR